MGNVWHDMSPKRITPTDFVMVAEAIGRYVDAFCK